MQLKNVLVAFLLLGLVILGFFLDFYGPFVAGILAILAFIVSFFLYNNQRGPIPEPTEPPVRPEPSEEAVAQTIVEQELYSYWEAIYEAYTNGVEDLRKFWEIYLIPRAQAADIPEPLKPIFGYYYQHVEQADWGNVYLYKNDLVKLWLIYVTTDGDDGWVELFNEKGKHLGTARRYIELLSWGDPEMIREMVKTGDYPAELESRMADTLWGK